MIATTIEQSKHLLELGIDPKTADMYWTCKQETLIATPKLMVEPPCGAHAWVLANGGIVAWSLEALFSLLPIECKLEKTLFDQSDYFTYACEWTGEYRTTEYENPINAVFEMICWLKENKRI